jgi:Fungal N-terminal domain of STAND proteins
MEPLSTASAVLGIVTAGVKLSTALYEIVETISGAGDEITAVASDLSFFVVVVDELGQIFESPEKSYKDLLETKVKDILKECREVFKGIQRMINHVDNREKPIPIVFRQRVQWVFRESRVKAVKSRLESLKSTLGLMLQTVKLRADR